MIPRQRLAIGCLLSGVPCIPNGYRFIQQEVLINLGWGLMIVGSLITLLGGYLLFMPPQKAAAPETTRNISAKRRTSHGRKQAKK